MHKFLLLLLFCFSLFAHPVEEKKLDKVTLQLHWKYQFEFAGFIAAKEKGFYKEAGLDVTLKEYENGMNIIDDVCSAKADFGIYNSSTLVEYLKGKPIVLVNSFFKRAALVLITKPTIHSPKDLRGKKIMATSLEDFQLNFKPYFDAYNVHANEFKLVPETFRVKEFVEGKVDAMTAFISDQPYRLDKLGVNYNILDPSSENLFVLQEELFTSRREVREHSDRVDAFREASIKGWKYALEHKEELIKIIHKKYNKEMPLDALRYEANAIERLILPSAYEIGSIDRNFLRKQMQFFQKEYKDTKEKSLEGFIYESKKADLHLTQEEKKYIKEHQNIKLCINYDLYPIDRYKNGEYSGIIADVFKIISQETSLQFTIVPATSEENLMQNLKEKKCKLLSLVAVNNRTFTTIQPTKPFVATHFAIVSKLNKSFVNDREDLTGKVLLVQKDSFKSYLEHFYPNLTIKVIDNKNKMVQKVLFNEAYGIVTLDEQADYFIDKYGYGKLKINGFLARENPIKGGIGVQKDEPILYNIMQKALSVIPKSSIEHIVNTWKINRYKTKIDYSLLMKVLIGFIIIFFIMMYYQRKLKNFNKELERQVNEKTKELREINESLEATVEEKVEELIQKDEILTAQSKQAVMGEMLSMIAHQWRQPLNTITLQISNIQLKEMMGQEVSKEELLDILNEISNSVVYLSNTIDDFKTYFQPDKKTTQIHMNELLEKVVHFIEPRAKRDNITITLTGEKNIEVRVYVNELIQVLLNILNNSIDAYETMQASHKEIVIFVEVRDNRVLINITDHAGGIPKDNIKKIFEPYFSTKGKNGTGLGLYMSKMIIEKQFNGLIHIVSQNDETTFTIDIPRDVRS
ncbi:ABC transporter substrate-binding protein [Sulfurimonas paralvinellae]|uniref:histidine kinase n=1 Tax=Sulfurimonas paralvinellae TaxID=317658 RepID=A0A7M1B726_9BACT|nr:ABC transporter substrate-binding protein [Sulfurimonas paralvinellae]QOP45503.1 transporter substrate-binding domain-containing protein [Sulfurimonas paralvinellae]